MRMYKIKHSDIVVDLDTIYSFEKNRSWCLRIRCYNEHSYKRGEGALSFWEESGQQQSLENKDIYFCNYSTGHIRSEIDANVLQNCRKDFQTYPGKTSEAFEDLCKVMCIKETPSVML